MSDASGQHPWRVTFGLVWLCTTSTFLVFATSFPFLTLYLQEMGQDRTGAAAWAGVINGVAVTIFGFMNIVWGAVADRWGTKSGIVRAQVFGVLGLLLCGLASGPELVFLGRVLQSVGGGPQSAAMVLTGALVPVSSMGMALGLLQMGQSVGGAVGPVIGGIVGDAIGYRYGFLVAAGIVAVISAVAAVFVKEPPRSPRSAARGGFFAGFLDTMHVPVLRDVNLLILCFQSAHQTIWTFLPLRIQEISPDPALVGTYSGAAFMGDALGIAIGATAMGWLAPRIGARNVLVGACVVAATATALQAFTTSIPLFVLLRFAAGLASGGMLTVSRTLLAQHAHPDRRGAVFGVSQGAFSVAFAFGAVVGSAIIAGWGLDGVFAAAVALVALSTIWAVRTTRPIPPVGA